jgi:transcriptional regulator of acetoin/glycerol metabolism
VDEILQSSFADLASIRGEPHSLLRLPNGLQVHVRCELQARDGHRHLFAVGKSAPEVLPMSAPEETAASPAVEPLEPASLRDADGDLIAKTLKECGGNVSAAARKLRVSRGLIYRRTQGA